MGRKLLLLFMVGDILGTGVHALTGAVAGEVGGAVWAPFLVAYVVALIMLCRTSSWSPDTHRLPVPPCTSTRLSASTS